MTTTTLALIGLDLVAMSILVLGIYFPRHRRSDLVAAFFGVNVGVLAVTMVLANSTVGAGLGLGLFGVLSIIRLRSDEITQREIAYYFASLSVGLITGMSTSISVMVLGLIGLILVALAVADSKLLMGNATQQQIQLDQAITNAEELRDTLAIRLNADITAVKVIKVDMVNDLTLVDVRFRPRPAVPQHAAPLSASIRSETIGNAHAA